MGKWGNKILPTGNSVLTRQIVRSSADVGDMACRQRQLLGLKHLEKGKPTLQLQMALEVLDLLGLKVVVQTKAGGLL